MVQETLAGALGDPNRMLSVLLPYCTSKLVKAERETIEGLPVNAWLPLYAAQLHEIIRYDTVYRTYQRRLETLAWADQLDYGSAPSVYDELVQADWPTRLALTGTLTVDGSAPHETSRIYTREFERGLGGLAQVKRSTVDTRYLGEVARNMRTISYLTSYHLGLAQNNPARDTFFGEQAKHTPVDEADFNDIINELTRFSTLLDPWWKTEGAAFRRTHNSLRKIAIAWYNKHNEPLPEFILA
jgi:hypothetical protein